MIDVASHKQSMSRHAALCFHRHQASLKKIARHFLHKQAAPVMLFAKSTRLAFVAFKSSNIGHVNAQIHLVVPRGTHVMAKNWVAEQCSSAVAYQVVHSRIWISHTAAWRRCPNVIIIV